MEPTDEGVNFANAGDVLAMADDIFYSPVPAAGNDHQPTVRFIDQYAFIADVIWLRCFRANNTIGLRCGYANFPGPQKTIAYRQRSRVYSIFRRE